MIYGNQTFGMSSGYDNKILRSENSWVHIIMLSNIHLNHNVLCNAITTVILYQLKKHTCANIVYPMELICFLSHTSISTYMVRVAHWDPNSLWDDLFPGKRSTCNMYTRLLVFNITFSITICMTPLLSVLKFIIHFLSVLYISDRTRSVVGTMITTEWKGFFVLILVLMLTFTKTSLWLKCRNKWMT